MNLAEFFRLIVVIGGAIGIGLSAATILVYSQLKKRGIAGPLATHVILLAVGHIGLIVSACVWIIHRYLENQPFTFFGTPWIAASFLCSNAGLTRLLFFEGHRTKKRAMIAKEEVLDLKRAADAVHEDHERRLKDLERKG